MKLRVKLDEGAKMPTRAYETDAGLDIYSPESVIVYKGRSVVIDTGVHIEIPKGYCGLLMSKSGLNVKHSITGEGVIDHGYVGGIVVKLYNNNTDDDAPPFHFFEKGDKLIQLLIVPIETPELELVENVADLYGSETERGDNGFGSSGK